MPQLIQPTEQSVELHGCIEKLKQMFFTQALVTNRFYGNAVGESTFHRRMYELNDILKLNKCKAETQERINRKAEMTTTTMMIIMTN